MSIYNIQPLHAGNALRISLLPPAGAHRWVVLRRDDDAFTGPDDALAFKVYDGNEKCVTDYFYLINGATVYYRVYYWLGAGWQASDVKTGIPAATFEQLTQDPLLLVRERLDLGLQVFVQRGVLIHSSGRVPVLTASPQVDQTPLPVVTIHLASDSSADRFVGEILTDDFVGADGLVHSVEGWFSRVQLTIIGWCLNADERITLRNALKTVLMSNLTVFDAAGLMQVDIQTSDQEDFVTYAAPVYQAVCNFTCYAPSAVDGVDPVIKTIITTTTATPKG